MAMMTYLIAFAHFSSEIFIFRTAKLTGPVISTVIVSSQSRPSSSFHIYRFVSQMLILALVPPTALSMTWMITQYDFYVKQ